MTSESIVIPLGAADSSASRYERFREFYDEYYPRLARYCFRLTGDGDSAHDLAQESFARVLSRWVRVRNPEAYIFQIALNLARTTYRRGQREEQAARAAHTEPRDYALPLHLAVRRLPRRYREVVLLYYFADLPVAKVAAAVRRPEGTVKRQLAEARALLASELESPDATLL